MNLISRQSYFRPFQSKIVNRQQINISLISRNTQKSTFKYLLFPTAKFLTATIMIGLSIQPFQICFKTVQSRFSRTLRRAILLLISHHYLIMGNKQPESKPQIQCCSAQPDSARPLKYRYMFGEQFPIDNRIMPKDKVIQSKINIGDPQMLEYQIGKVNAIMFQEEVSPKIDDPLFYSQGKIKSNIIQIMDEQFRPSSMITRDKSANFQYIRREDALFQQFGSSACVLDEFDIRKKLERKFIPQFCIGLIRHKGANFNKQAVINAFLISSKLAIANLQAMGNYQKHQLAFYFYFERRQYEIEDIFEKQDTLEDEYPPNYSFIRLKTQIQIPKYLQLSINFQRNFNDMEFLCQPSIYYDRLPIKSARIKEYQLSEDKKQILYSTDLSSLYNGSPIVFRKNGQSYVIGIHAKDENEQARYNSTGTIIEENFIVALCKWLPQADRKSLKVYLQNEDRSMTLSDFVSYLNIESRLYPSWLKFDKSKFIKKSDEMLAQRLGGYIDFQGSGRFIEFITVNGIRLYFELYHPEKIFTVLDLKQQYLQITKSALLLSTKDLILSVNIALKSIIYDKKTREMFEKLLNQMQKGAIRLSSYPNWFLEDLQRLKKTQIYINMPKKQQKISITVKKQERLIEHFDYQYQQKANIVQVLAYLSTKQYDFQNVEVYNRHGLINEKDYSQAIKDRELTIFLIGNQSFISKRCKVWIFQASKKKELSLEELEQNNSKASILSFQQATNKLMFQDFNKTVINWKVSTIYTITYKSKDVTLDIECSANTLFKLSNNKWAKAKNIQLGNIILGVNQVNDGLIEYQIIKRQIRYEPIPQIFACFEVENTHNFIANRLLIHNSNTFSITVIKRVQDKQTEQPMTFYRNQVIEQAFSENDVWLGGTKLNKQLTFGDYQIESSKCLFITQKEANIQGKDLKVDLLVTKWNEVCLPYQNYEAQEKSKIKEHYVGLINGRFARLDDELFDKLQQSNTPHLIIEKKQKLRRINYYSRQEQLLCNERQTLQKYKDLRQSAKFKQVCQKIHDQISKGKGISANQANSIAQQTIEDIFPIFVYTTSVYKQLNKTLRGMEIVSKKQSQSEHLLSLSSIITRSIRKLPSFNEEKIVYRGIADCNIDFKGATNNVILFEGFTSATTSRIVAARFATNNGVVLEIKTLTGKHISRYSFFQEEEEVLLNPFTYFFYEGQYRDEETSRKTIKLRQICLPFGRKESLTFWIDDKPFNNSRVIREICEETEVVEVCSTQMMKVILKDFFWIYTFLGKRIVIVSDMVRKEEDGRVNKQAGADLLRLIYNQMGLSNSAFIFTSNHARTEIAMHSRNVEGNRWIITTIQSEIRENIIQISNSRRLVS